MQIKPFFEKYEEISRTPLLSDDRGVQYSFVHFKAVKIDDPYDGPHYETIQNYKSGLFNSFRSSPRFNIRHEYEGYIVMSDKLTNYQNGTTSYDETLYWSQPKKLTSFEIDGFRIIEVFCGQNAFFEGELPTMNTEFKIYPIKL